MSVTSSGSGSEEAERVRKEYISKLEEYNYFKDIGQVGFVYLTAPNNAISDVDWQNRRQDG